MDNDLTEDIICLLFQDLLSLDSAKHPIFFLKDVKYTELKALIQYMYRGEVNIAQEDLPSLLAVAQALKIRGLAEVETTNNSISSDTIILPDLTQAQVKNKGIMNKNPPVAATVPTASSSLHAPRSSFSQGQFSNPSVSTSMTSSTVAPPAAKRARTEPTRLSAQNSHIQQNQSQMVDPLLNVQILPQVIPSQDEGISQMQDPLQSTPMTRASTSRFAAATREEIHYDNSGMIEEPEMYGNEGIVS